MIEENGTADAAILDNLIQLDERDGYDERSPSPPLSITITPATDEESSSPDNLSANRPATSLPQAGDVQSESRKLMPSDATVDDMSTDVESLDLDDSPRSMQNRADELASMDIVDPSPPGLMPAPPDTPASPSSEEEERKASVARFRNRNIIFPALIDARCMRLDTMDISLLPEWLREPVTYLARNFRGEGEAGEDNLLKLWIAVEVLWEHAKVCLTFHLYFT